MGWREFLKPDWRKIVLFIVTMGGLNYWLITSFQVLDARILVGMPIGFYPIGGFNLSFGQNPPIVEFSWLNFILDIVFWYLVACVVFYSLDHVIKKIKERYAWKKMDERWNKILAEDEFIPLEELHGTKN